MKGGAMKLVRGVLRLIDYVAVALVGGLTASFIWVTLLGTVRFVWHLLRDMWRPGSDRILLMIAASAFAWCALRRRAIGIAPHRTGD